MKSPKNEKNTSFRAFLKEVFLNHPVTVRYFGEIFAWLFLGGFLTWLVFPNAFAKPSDLRGFGIFIPVAVWALLRGVYVLWKDDQKSEL